MYTSVYTASTQSCTWQVGLLGRVHGPRRHVTAVGAPCTRSCTRPIHSRVYVRLHGQCTRPRTRTVYRNGPHTAAACRLGTGTWRGRLTCHVHDEPCTRPCAACTRPVQTNIYRAVYGPCTWPVYTAVYWPCTRPCNGGVHVCVCTRPCTRPRTGRVGPRRRLCTCRVQGRGPCTRLVRSVLLQFSLQKTPFIPKRTAINALHSKRARTTSAPSAALWRTTALRTMLIIG